MLPLALNCLHRDGIGVLPHADVLVVVEHLALAVVRMLIGWPTNQTLPTSDVAPLASAVIWFLFVRPVEVARPGQAAPVLQVDASRARARYPVFFVEPTFCSVDVKPDVTGSSRVSSRSCVFSL